MKQWNKPYIREYSAKCVSTKGTVWVLSQRYIFDEATTLTRRVMRELGQVIEDDLSERTKNASEAVKYINKEKLKRTERENARSDTSILLK